MSQAADGGSGGIGIEHGVESVSDVGHALEDGWQDLRSAVGGWRDAGGDIVDAIF